MWYIKIGNSPDDLVLDYYNKSSASVSLGCVHWVVYTYMYIHILLNGTWTAARSDADRSHPLSRLQFFLNTILSLPSLTP